MMKKKIAKSNLPEKPCLVCGRNFTWRKKWEKGWDDVKYCSDKCRMNKNTSIKHTNA
jgi:hypothetical protein